jgi:hypothetical protein
LAARPVGRAALDAALASSKSQGPSGPRRRNKYGVAPREERSVDGIVFDSKAEAARWRELEALRREGAVRFVLRQVPFHLPGGVRYVCDFAVFWADGRTTFEDVKGHATEVYRLKKRQVEALYPVAIEEVRRRR